MFLAHPNKCKWKFRKKVNERRKHPPHVRPNNSNNEDARMMMVMMMVRNILQKSIKSSFGAVQQILNRGLLLIFTISMSK